MGRLSFAKVRRLATNSQFRAVMARGLCASDGLLMVYACENRCGYPRLGVSIGRSCGIAVVRNRIKRLLREAFRRNQERIGQPFDYVVMMSPRWVRRVAGPSASLPSTALRARRRGAKDAVKALRFERVRDSFVALAAEAAGGGRG